MIALTRFAGWKRAMQSETQQFVGVHVLCFQKRT